MPMPAGAALAVAALAVLLMGFAIQRGATCTVAAVDEWVDRRGTARLQAMVEASVWVAGGLAIALLAGVLPAVPRPYAASAATVLGGALLGLGAWLGGACVFGAIARFGNGEWAYAATPLGFFAGCLTVGIFGPQRIERLDSVSPLLRAPQAVALLFAAFVLWRIGPGLARLLRGRGRLREAAVHGWTPRAATTVIGITFLVALLAAGGTWAYTDVLAEAARGMAAGVPARLALFACLLAGAVLGGRLTDRYRPKRASAGALLRCFCGGVLMGWGSLLIPGANDGLILVGMPLLWPYAWLAFATMCVTIAAAMRLARWRRPASAQVSR
jgi:uncharacterized membrane protein YedE/YeeE